MIKRRQNSITLYRIDRTNYRLNVQSVKLYLEPLHHPWLCHALLSIREDSDCLIEVTLPYFTLPLSKGVHPPEAMMHFPPLFQISPYFRKISDSAENFPNVTFPKKISDFHPPKFLRTFF